MKTKEEYLKEGYSIVHSDREYLTLERSKKFRVWLFITLLVFTGIGGIAYLFYYVGKGNDRVTIEKSVSTKAKK